MATLQAVIKSARPAGNNQPGFSVTLEIQNAVTGEAIDTITIPATNVAAIPAAIATILDDYAAATATEGDSFAGPPVLPTVTSVTYDSEEASPGGPGVLTIRGDDFDLLTSMALYFADGEVDATITPPDSQTVEHTATIIKLVANDSTNMSNRELDSFDLIGPHGTDNFTTDCPLDTTLTEPAPTISSITMSDTTAHIHGTNLDRVDTVDVTTNSETYEAHISSRSPIELQLDFTVTVGEHPDPILSNVLLHPQTGPDVSQDLTPPDELSLGIGTFTASIVDTHIQLASDVWKMGKVVQCVLFFNDDTDSGLLMKGVGNFDEATVGHVGIIAADYSGKNLSHVHFFRNHTGSGDPETTEPDASPSGGPLPIP